MQRRSMGIALAAVFVALTAVFGALPFVFLVPVLLAALTTDFKTSFIVSAFFGVISLLYSFMGGSIVAVAFVSAPWIPIAARIFVGPAARGAFLLVGKCFRTDSRAKTVVSAAVGALAGTLTNTALVVTLLILVTPSETLFAGVPAMLISGAIELAVNIVALPPLALAVNKVRERKAA